MFSSEKHMSHCCWGHLLHTEPPPVSPTMVLPCSLIPQQAAIQLSLWEAPLSVPCRAPYEGCPMGGPPRCTASVAMGRGLDNEIGVMSSVGWPCSLFPLLWGHSVAGVGFAISREA